MLNRDRAFRFSFGQEPDGDYRVPLPIEPQILRLCCTSEFHVLVGEPLLSLVRLGPRVEESFNRHIECARLACFESSIAPLSARPQSLDALVSNGDSLRPPRRHLVLLTDQRRNLAMRHFFCAVVVE